MTTFIKRNRLRAFTTIVAACLGLGAGSAAFGETIGDGQGDDLLQAHDREYLIDRNFTRGGPQGILDVGDSLRGHAIWNIHPGNPQLTTELTSVFQVRVTRKAQVNPNKFLYAFGPDPTFAEAQALGLGGSAMMIFYEDTNNNASLDYDDANSPYPSNTIDDGTTLAPPSPEDVSFPASKVHEEAFIATATDGQYFWALGFTGQEVDGVTGPADGEGWRTKNGMTENVLDFFGSSGLQGHVEFALSQLESPTDGFGSGPLLLASIDSPFDSNYTVHVEGDQELRGVKNTNTAFEIATRSGLNFTVIPLPPAAGMAVILLTAMGGIKWMRDQNETDEIV